MSTNTETVTTGAPAEAPPKGKPQLSEGARAERRLGFMLIAPAVIVMIAVTAYPVVYAIYLSLERYNLELPNAIKFVGLGNWLTVEGPFVEMNSVTRDFMRSKLSRNNTTSRASSVTSPFSIKKRTTCRACGSDSIALREGGSNGCPVSASRIRFSTG